MNKAILVGRLTRDPEVRDTQGGTKVAKFSLAINRRGKDGGTDYINCTAFGKTAELAAQYLRKGSQIYVEGSIRTRKWQDQATGQDRYATEIRVDQMQMLGKREGMGGGGDAYGQDEGAFGGGYGGGRAAPRQAAPMAPRAAAPAAAAPAAAAPMASQPVADAGGFGDMDDDIPF